MFFCNGMGRFALSKITWRRAECSMRDTDALLLLRTQMGHSTSVFSRYREDRSSVHGATACNYPLISTGVDSLTCGFANCPKATCADPLAIAAGGLRAKGRLSFKAGVFGAIEPQKAARCALWDKNENSKP